MVPQPPSTIAPCRSAPCRSARWASSGPGSWAPASPRWPQPAGHQVIVRSRSQPAADSVLAGVRRSLDRQIERGNRTEAERDEILVAHLGHHRAEGPGRRRPGDRVGGRGPGGEARAVRGAPRGVHRSRRCSPPTPRRSRWSTSAMATGRPEQGVRHPLLQSGHRHGPGRDRPPDHGVGGDDRRRPSSSPRRAARSRSRSRTGPASWSTRSSSPT